MRAPGARQVGRCWDVLQTVFSLATCALYVIDTYASDSVLLPVADLPIPNASALAAAALAAADGGDRLLTTAHLEYYISCFFALDYALQSYMLLPGLQNF